MELYSYFRSSTSYRTRIALNYKGIDYKLISINLVSGEHHGDTYSKVNPQKLVPSLRLDDGQIIAQSIAIIEYLEEVYPEPALLAADQIVRAQQRAMAMSIACEIHPINNLRVLNYLTNELKINDEQKSNWYTHWIMETFNVLEPQLTAQPYALGDQISIVDVFLIPQVFNALRFKVPLKQYPKIKRVYESCNLIESFQQATPESQPN